MGTPSTTIPYRIPQSGQPSKSSIQMLLLGAESGQTHVPVSVLYTSDLGELIILVVSVYLGVGFLDGLHGYHHPIFVIDIKRIQTPSLSPSETWQ